MIIILLIKKNIINLSPIENLKIDKNLFNYNEQVLKLSPNFASYLRFFIKRN